MNAVADIETRIEPLFRGFRAPLSPGAAVAVTKDGEEIFAGCYGLADINHGVPIARDTLMRIGSQTKQFTVLLTLMLEAEGKLSLDDPVQDHLPWLPRFPHPVTLRHLAANTSGVRDFLEAMIFAGRSIFTPGERQTARDALARQDALNFVPGSAMIYSNSGFFMLSEIIETLEDACFDEVLKRRITTPLGMADTHMMPRDSTVRPRLAAHYAWGDEAWRRLGWGIVLGGEGGMISTLDDMRLWQRTLERGEAPWAPLWKRMEAPTVYANGKTGLYGLGLVNEPYRGRRAVGHGGSVSGGRSESMRFPDDGLGIVILANNDRISTFSLARRIADAVFGDPPPEGRLPAAAGFYRQENGSEVFEIVEQDGRSFLRSADGDVPLQAASDGWFRPERGITDLSLSPRPDGTLDGLWCGAARRYRKLTPRRADAALSGRYANAAQGLDVVIEGDAIAAEFRLRSDLGAFGCRIEALDRDLWLMRPADTAIQTGDGWMAVLTATASGFVLSSERTRGLSFEKVA